MNKILLLLAIFIALQITGANGQNLIAVQNGSNASFYSNVASAIEAAGDGDTIYIPGGNWIIGNLIINKSIHVFGNGYNQDSMISSLPTRLHGDVMFQNGSDNTSIVGIDLQGSLNGSVKNLIISRSIFYGFNLSASNLVFIENIILGDTRGQLLTSSQFYNNIFGHITPFRDVPRFSNCQFRNNLFLRGAYGNRVYYPVGSTESLFENNIFLKEENTPTTEYCHQSIFNNNLFVENWSQNDCGNCLGTNNVILQEQSSIFINQSGNYYSKAHNYHLNPNSLGKNAGTDGKDIGIYGGLFPWKDGALPSIPHVILKQISNTTDQNGNLQINMIVKAQNN